MITIEYEGVDVGAEIDPDDPNPSQGNAATVRYFVERDNRRIYISYDDARAIIDLDRNAWARALRDAIERLDPESRR